MLLALLALLALATGTASPRATLFVNARVLTLEADDGQADTLLLVDGRIAALGRRDSPIPRSLREGATVVDAGGRVLMPGFVDAHSHFPAVNLARFGVDLAPPPDGDVDDIASLLSRLATKPGDEWLLGLDYDESGLAEARHPTRTELDAAFGEREVWLRHRSGHMGVGNSAALRTLGIDEDYVPPVGGLASRDADGRLDGLLQENAAPPLTRLLREVPLAIRLKSLWHARDVYLAAGVTTVQNGHASPALALLLAAAGRTGTMPQSVVVWQADDADAGASDRAMHWLADRLGREGQYTIAAVKIILDGSPQGMTAWLTEPYAATSGQRAAYRGFATVMPHVSRRRVAMHHQAGRRLALHANGDAAIDAALDALEAALQAHPRADHRHLIVHAQTARRDQLQRMVQLGVGASFFPTHVRYWGIWHRDVALGQARAARVSPLAEADALGVRYSLHTDTPVTPMRPFDVVSAASERLLATGAVMGPELRVSRLRALRALTIDAAWQAGLDNDRGTLTVGKRADVLMLSAHPLEARDLASIKVDGVWIEGRHVFERIESERLQ